MSKLYLVSGNHQPKKTPIQITFTNKLYRETEVETKNDQDFLKIELNCLIWAYFRHWLITLRQTIITIDYKVIIRRRRRHCSCFRLCILFVHSLCAYVSFDILPTFIRFPFNSQNA